MKRTVPPDALYVGNAAASPLWDRAWAGEVAELVLLGRAPTPAERDALFATIGFGGGKGGASNTLAGATGTVGTGRDALCASAADGTVTESALAVAGDTLCGAPSTSPARRTSPGRRPVSTSTAASQWRRTTGVRRTAYIDYMRPRCVELARVLKKTGSFYYHCDWHASNIPKVGTALRSFCGLAFLLQGWYKGAVSNEVIG